MKDVIDFFLGQKNEIGNVVLDETVIRVSRQMADVRCVARNEIVDCDHAVAFCQQTVSQVRSEEASAASDD